MASNPRFNPSSASLAYGESFDFAVEFDLAPGSSGEEHVVNLIRNSDGVTVGSAPILVGAEAAEAFPQIDLEGESGGAYELRAVPPSGEVAGALARREGDGLFTFTAPAS